MAIFTLALSTVYLGWRAMFTLEGDSWWAAGFLLVLEIHNVVGLFLYTLAGWKVDAQPPARPVDRTDLSIAVLITTYNEPTEIILPAIAAALDLQPAHETWVLDDGNRPEIRELATGLGASYLARPTNEHAKAGNLNNALGKLNVDLIAVLDADHVPTPDFLRNTIGYFDDPDVAVVQTPQDFYNTDSFEHHVRSGDQLFNEETVFYRVILPAKNRWNAAFWCGTGAVLRTEALRSVGGVATETVTEDIHTSIRMHALGWRTVAHNEVLAQGLAAADARQYLLQRNRWSAGAMQVLRIDNPLTRKGLKLAQRLAYAATLFAWFDAWRSLGYVILPAAVVLTGASPVRAPAEVYLPVFAIVLASQFGALRLLARGYYPPMLSVLFETLRMPAVLPATTAILGRNLRFRPTPKGRTDSGRGQIAPPRLLMGLAGLSALALVVLPFGLDGMLPWDYRSPGAAAVSGAFCGLNLILLIAAIRRIHSLRFAGERRNAYRFEIDWPGRYEGRACRVVDLSMTGAQIEVDDNVPERSRDAADERNQLVVTSPSRGSIRLNVLPRHLIGHGAGHARSIGLALAPGQLDALREVALAIFPGPRAPELGKSEALGELESPAEHEHSR
ncbi:MAG: glycosyltransferase [Acidimicrobiales bacterium]